jgi:hypothetical protein
MPSCKSDPSWIVEEIEVDEDSTSATVRISQPTTYNPEQAWPEPRQELVVKAEQ